MYVSIYYEHYCFHPLAADRRSVNETELKSTECFYPYNDSHIIFTTVGCTITLHEDQSNLQVAFLQCMLSAHPGNGEGLTWEYDREKLVPMSHQALPTTARGKVTEMENVLMILVVGGDAFASLKGLSVTCKSGDAALTSTFSV